jgi:excisionase family DNA binding protein
MFRQPGGSMTARREAETPPVLLDVEEAARRLGTKPRFIRRLIAERRIEFHKVGRHVRISEAALADFIEAGKVPAVDASELWRAERMSA